MNRFSRILAALGIGTVSLTASAELPSFDLTPDGPESFGYKVNWLAIQATDPVSVAKTLGVEPTVLANWASGIKAAYGRPTATDKGSWVFVSNPVKGWIFVVSGGLPYPVMHTQDRFGGIGQKFDAMFSRLSNVFSETQFFGSYRVVGFVAWARASKDKPIRIFSMADGEVYANIGDQTPEESSLHFVELSGLSPRLATERIFSVEDGLLGEDDVNKLASLWSIDPSQISETDAPAGLGLVGKLPKSIDTR